MPKTKHKKRINLSVSDETNEVLEKLAKRDDVPVATKTLELLKEALIIAEDEVLDELAQERDIQKVKYIDHSDVWK